MNAALYQTLTERNIIKVGSVIKGRSLRKGLGGMPQMVLKIGSVRQVCVGALVCKDNLNTYVMQMEDIEEIDGMDPKRLASVYNIKADGTAKPVGKKRGRKRKHPLPGE